MFNPFRRRPSSEQVRANATCSQCQAPFELSLWTLVHGGVDPDMLAPQLVAKLRKFSCPNGHEAAVDVPLLLFRPGSDPELIFYPTKGADRGKAANELGSAFDQLVRQDRERFHDPQAVYEDACVIPIGKIGEYAELDAGATLPGSTLRFYHLLLEADKVSAESEPDRTVAAWETILQHPCFSEAPAWFRRRAIAETAASHFRRGDKNLAGGDSDRTIELFDEALQLTAAIGASRAALEYNLGAALCTRSELSGSRDDADRGIPLLIAGRSEENPVVRTRMNRHIGRAHLVRYEAYRQPEDIEQALQFLLEPANHPEVVTEYDFAMVLANAYREKALLDLNATFFTDASRTLERSLERRDVSDATRAKLLDALGLCHHQHSQVTGRASELTTAIGIRERAVEVADGADLPMILSNLAGSYRLRFERSGNIGELETASRHVRRGLDIAEPGSRAIAALLDNWGGIARDFSFRDEDDSWLDTAIEAFTKAIEIQTDASPGKASCLTNLGLTLMDRAMSSRSAAGMDPAIENLEYALRLTPSQDVERAGRLLNLGGAYMRRFDLLGRLSDLDKALDVLSDASASAQPGSYEETNVISTIALVRQKRFEVTKLETDALEATRSHRKGCEQARSVSLVVAFHSALNWGHWAFDRRSWAEAVEAFEISFEALDGLTSSQSDYFGQQTWIAEAQVLGTSACYAYAMLGDARNAALSIERSRGRLLGSQLARWDARLGRLNVPEHRHLLDEYEALSGDLQRVQAGERITDLIARQSPEKRIHRASRGLHNSKDSFTREVTDDLARKATKTQERLADCIERIRSVPGLETFRKAPTWTDLTEVLNDDHPSELRPHALLYIAVTSLGAVALIVREDRQEAVFLDDLTGSAIVEMISSRGGYSDVLRDAEGADEALVRTMDGLSRSIFRPLRSRIVEAPSASVSTAPARLLLIPSGPLSIFPLHACHLDPDNPGETLLDRFVVQYAISAIAWQRCRDTAFERRKIEPSVLAVGNPLPLPEECEPLLAAEAEAHAVAANFGDGSILLCGEAATTEVVERRLDDASFLHFACHGSFDLQHPNGSGLTLGGGSLSLINLVTRGKRLSSRLAVMSACQTALIDLQRFPEEAVGLPAGFIEAGLPAAIGSFWPVDDVSTALLMDRFYGILLGGKAACPADALRLAQIWLRDATSTEIEAHLSTSALGKLLGDLRPAIDPAEPTVAPYGHPFHWAPFSYHGA